MSDRDTNAVLAVVRRAVDAAPGNKRDLETAMGIGHGRINDLFDGRLELRARHVTGLARYLKVPASDFFRVALAEAERVAPGWKSGSIRIPRHRSSARKPHSRPQPTICAG
ncbi:MAG TPA: hypothetical protein VN851_18045 [Thermoanaerobaculia bacterium]|nr:hypothetical protein [Thermoanaerobaculia bacterium]